MEVSPPSPSGYIELNPLGSLHAQSASSIPPISPGLERYEFKYLSQTSPMQQQLRKQQQERQETESESSITTSQYEQEMEAQWLETQATLATLVNLLLIPWSSRELGKKFSQWCSSFVPTLESPLMSRRQCTFVI